MKLLAKVVNIKYAATAVGSNYQHCSQLTPAAITTAVTTIDEDESEVKGWGWQFRAINLPCWIFITHNEDKANMTFEDIISFEFWEFFAYKGQNRISFKPDYSFELIKVLTVYPVNGY